MTPTPPMSVVDFIEWVKAAIASAALQDVEQKIPNSELLAFIDGQIDGYRAQQENSVIGDVKAMLGYYIEAYQAIRQKFFGEVKP